MNPENMSPAMYWDFFQKSRSVPKIHEYNHCQIQWQYASAASQLCSCLIHKENKYQSDNPKRHFRTVTLQLLQQNFKKRTELRKEEGKFLGLVSYIAGLYRVSFSF